MRKTDYNCLNSKKLYLGISAYKQQKQRRKKEASLFMISYGLYIYNIIL